MNVRGLAVTLAVAVVVGGIAAEAASAGPNLAHSGRWFTDARGRAIVLHGVAVMDFGPKHLPSVQGFSSDDAAFLAAHGFNVVRVGFNWSGLEPKPGVIDAAYLASIVSTVRQLGAQRIWSVLDLHQDGWGPAVNGQDGAPAWATLTDGAPNPPLPFGANYFGNPALERAFDNFWANAAGPGAVGLQDRYAAMMAKLAKAMRGQPYVLGYEVMNEPWPGSQYPSCMDPQGCPVFDSQQLTGFYRRVIPQVRRADPPRMVFYEPNLFFDFGAATNLSDPAPGDRLTGFTFHDYCLGAGAGSALPVLPQSGEACPVEENMTLANAETYSHSTGAALLNTEWSATADLDTVARMAAELDADRLSNTYWQYCCAADNATLVADARKPPRAPNLHGEVLSRIDRPYPRAVSGTPLSWLFVPSTRRFVFDYSTGPLGGGSLAGAPTEVYVPKLQYRSGYSVRLTGAAITSSPTSGLIGLCAPRGTTRVTILLAPDRGGATGPPTGRADCSPSTPDRVSVTPSTRTLTVARRGGAVGVDGLLGVQLPPPRNRCLRRLKLRFLPAKGAEIVSATLRVERLRRVHGRLVPIRHGRLIRLRPRGQRSFKASRRLPAGTVGIELLARVRARGKLSALRIVRTYAGCGRTSPR